MSSHLPKLSPTSYALLGLLTRAPQSAYELNQLMQGSLLRVYWPRAASHVYSEPKKLLAHGLVGEHEEHTGSRKRTVYTITPKGREALSAWLEEEGPSELRSQSEFMLKLILANEGPKEAAGNTLARASEESLADIEEAIAGIEAILQNPELAEHGMPWNGISINLMAEILVARQRWHAYAEEAAVQAGKAANSGARSTQGRRAYQRALDILRRARD